MKTQTVQETLRQALNKCGMSRAEVSRQTGIDQAVLSRFNGGFSLRGENLDKLAHYLALELTPQTGKRRKDQIPEGTAFNGFILAPSRPPREKPAKRKGS